MVAMGRGVGIGYFSWRWVSRSDRRRSVADPGRDAVDLAAPDRAGQLGAKPGSLPIEL